MKVVILGAGRRGRKLARLLTEEKKDVLIIDENPETVKRIMEDIDCLAYEANGTDINQLEEAGVRGADAFIALTSSDETNLVSCSLAASEFNIPTTICTIKNISYTKRQNLMGISHIINPFEETAKSISRGIERGIYSDIISFENSSLVLYNVQIEKGSKYAGKKVKEIRAFIPAQFIIAALLRNSVASVPSGDTVIQAGDTLSLAADEKSVESILSAVGKTRQKTKRIAIVGGNKVADFLISNTQVETRKHMTLIDYNLAVCEDFASRYPDILVINENITREGAFRQAGLEEYDLLICLSDTDERNILIASYAKSAGVKAVISVVGKNADYLRIANHLNIDAIISVQNESVDSIMRYLHGTNVSTLHSLFDGSIEAFEYKVTSSSQFCSKMLKDIDMRGKGIITGIVKDDKTIIPNGNTVIEEGNTLIMVAERKATEFIQSLIAEN